MTDEELIVFLRTSTSASFNKIAADRIEALVKERDALISNHAMIMMGKDMTMSDHDLTPRGDAPGLPKNALSTQPMIDAAVAAALPAVTVDEGDVRRAVLDWIKFDVSSAFRTVFQIDLVNALIARVLAALTPTAVGDSQAADPVVNAPAAIREAVEWAVDFCDKHDFRDGGLPSAVEEILEILASLKKGAANDRA